MGATENQERVSTCSRGSVDTGGIGLRSRGTRGAGTTLAAASCTLRSFSGSVVAIIRPAAASACSSDSERIAAGIAPLPGRVGAGVCATATGSAGSTSAGAASTGAGDSAGATVAESAEASAAGAGASVVSVEDAAIAGSVALAEAVSAGDVVSA